MSNYYRVTIDIEVTDEAAVMAASQDMAAEAGLPRDYINNIRTAVLWLIEPPVERPGVRIGETDVDQVNEYGEVIEP